MAFYKWCISASLDAVWESCLLLSFAKCSKVLQVYVLYQTAMYFKVKDWIQLFFFFFQSSYQSYQVNAKNYWIILKYYKFELKFLLSILNAGTEKKRKILSAEEKCWVSLSILIVNAVWVKIGCQSIIAMLLVYDVLNFFLSIF